MKRVFSLPCDGTIKFFDSSYGFEIKNFIGPFHPNGEIEIILTTWLDENGERNYGNKIVW